MTFIFISCWYCCWTFNTRSIDTPIQKVAMWCDPQINRELNSWTWTHHHQIELLELIYNCVGKYDSQFTVRSRQRKRANPHNWHSSPSLLPPNLHLWLQLGPWKHNMPALIPAVDLFSASYCFWSNVNSQMNLKMYKKAIGLNLYSFVCVVKNIPVRF